MKTFDLTADGCLSVKDEEGSSWEIQPHQIAAFRRDPAFEAALPEEIRGKLDESEGAGKA